MRKLSCHITTTGDQGVTIYGVDVRTNKGECFSYPCVSGSKAQTEELSRRLNGEDLDPAQLNDIVRDYITELYLDRLLKNGIAG